jgi:hypothetical protein
MQDLPSTAFTYYEEQHAMQLNALRLISGLLFAIAASAQSQGRFTTQDERQARLPEYVKSQVALGSSQSRLDEAQKAVQANCVNELGGSLFNLTRHATTDHLMVTVVDGKLKSCAVQPSVSQPLSIARLAIASADKKPDLPKMVEIAELEDLIIRTQELVDEERRLTAIQMSAVGGVLASGTLVVWWLRKRQAKRSRA